MAVNVRLNTATASGDVNLVHDAKRLVPSEIPLRGISCPPGGSDQTLTAQWPTAILGCFVVRPYASKLATVAQQNSPALTR